MRQIAACKSNACSQRQPQQASEKGFDPRLLLTAPHSERNQAYARLSAHRRDVAQRASQRALANQAWCEARAKMHSFDQLIRLQQEILAGFRPVDGAIVADAGYQLRTAP